MLWLQYEEWWGKTAEGAVKGSRGGEGNPLNVGGERIFNRL
jgi:hypothetical protein